MPEQRSFWPPASHATDPHTSRGYHGTIPNRSWTASGGMHMAHNIEQAISVTGLQQMDLDSFGGLGPRFFLYPPRDTV